jgi:hypothetical protein
VLRIPAADILKDPDQIAEAVIAFARSSPGRGGGPAQPRRRGLSGDDVPASNPLHPSPSASGPPPRKRGGS